ncbi:MAG TPA: PIN domain-containing protein [Terriglobia bacterium]|nr:PIN domain-containing protein [Terriglobia bacterium]
MICADTSSMVAYFRGERGRDVELVDQALADGLLVLAPASVAELLSYPELSPSLERSLLEIMQLEITSGYWERVGRLRALLFRHRLRPKLADSLIAQSCLDHDTAVVTRDRDFAGFQRLARLRVLHLEPGVQ